MTDRVQAYEDSLRMIARAAVTARAHTGPMGQVPPHVGEELLCDVEYALASLIALGAVPAAPGHNRAIPPADGRL